MHRVEAFYHFPQKAKIEDVVSIMNKAATEDVTATQVWPVLHAVLATGRAPSDRAKLADELVTSWAARGASRLDADLDGKIDDPGAPILDLAFTKMATAVLGARIGPLTRDLAELMSPDQNPQGRNGSSFGGGWYGYVDKDLRALLGRKVRGRFALSYCGRGSLARCRAEPVVRARRGRGRARRRSRAPTRACGARTRRTSASSSPRACIADTMRWTNRPTFQQVLRFGAKP